MQTDWSDKNPQTSNSELVNVLTLSFQMSTPLSLLNLSYNGTGYPLGLGSQLTLYTWLKVTQLSQRFNSSNRDRYVIFVNEFDGVGAWNISDSLC